MKDIAMRVACCLVLVALPIASAQQTFAMPWWHPTLQNIAVNRIPGPSTHSPVDNQLTGILNALMNDDDETHDPFDCPRGLICRPDSIDNDHPNLDRIFVPAPPPANMAVSIGHFHPDVTASYRAGVAISNTHPNMMQLLASSLPVSHPNVDTQLRNPAAHPLPWWHPPLAAFVSRRPAVSFTTSVSSFHENIDTALAARRPISATHPSVQSLFAGVLSATHPNLDQILRNPATNPLPSWHPPIERYITRRAPVQFTTSIGAYHPDADASFAAGTPISNAHPSVHALFATVLSPTHPNLDTVLRDPANNPFPAGHPPMSQYISRRGAVNFTVSVSSFHDNVTTAFASNQPISATHPSVQGLMGSVLSATHPNVDQILRNPAANPLPSWHPPLDRYTTARSAVQFTSSIGAYHPDADASYAAGTPISNAHPSVHALYAAVLSPTHPNLDTVLRNPAANPFPAGHPPMSQFLTRRAAVNFTVSVASFHDNVTTQFANNVPISATHPSVQTLMASALSATHPNVDQILRNPAANPLPSWHPDLERYVERRASVQFTTSIGAYHPDIDASFTAGTPISNAHPTIHNLYASILTPTHPNIDAALRDPTNNPLPAGHPPMSQFVVRRAAVNFTVSVSSFHDNVTTRFANNVPISATHPSVQTLMASVLSATHPNVDQILRNPAANPLPSWHPDLERYVARRTASSTNVTVSIGAYHPDVDASFAAGTPISSAHPTIHSLYSAILSATHPNIDAALRDPTNNPLPTGHPPISQFVSRRAAVQFTVPVSGYHTDVDAAFAAGEEITSTHPSVQTLMGSVLSSSHPNVDTILRDPDSNPMPSWHPDLEQYLVRRARADSSSGGWRLPKVSIAYDHPDADKSYADGTPLPGSHPPVQDMLKGHLPPNHPNVDTLMKNPSAHPLPSWHPRLNDMVENRSFWSPGLIFSVILAAILLAAYLLRVREWLAGKLNRSRQTSPAKAGPNPTLVRSVAALAKETPSDSTLGVEGESKQARSRTPSPEGPDQRPSGRRPTQWSQPDNRPSDRRPTQWIQTSNRLSLPQPQSQLKSAPQADKLYASPSDIPPSPPPRRTRPTSELRHAYSIRMPEAPEEPVYAVPQETIVLPRRSRSIRHMREKHLSHRAADPMYQFEQVATDVPQTIVSHRMANEVEQTCGRDLWVRLTETRIPSTQWTTGNAIFCFFYIAFNILALLIATTYSIERGLGSLAAANTMFLVLPATRNNILTWFLGMPFDHIILHHRFIGRVTVLLSLLHGALYFDRFLKYSTEHVYWTGMAALWCGLGIAATTTDYIRRQQFNLFFWAHYLFFGFFAFAYVHVRQAQPFLIAAVAIYALDKFLRFFWTLLPMRTIMFRNRGEKTTQVRWNKNPLTRMMGKHRVGQYVFVNFPELSLTEWHPFSVSSGPNEDFIELHIRNLGNHTKKIVAHSKKCAEEGRQVLIRSDGPYGYLDFDYRRYGVLMLVGGGIGITPVISILKDIYGEGRSSKPHCMKWVYVVWVMPHTGEAELFMDALASFEAAAATDSTLPGITVLVHCTRAKKGEVKAPIVAGRPDFPQTMDEIFGRFSGSPTLVFACGPGRMVNQLWDESTSRSSRHQRVDFHHETFEF